MSFYDDKDLPKNQGKSSNSNYGTQEYFVLNRQEIPISSNIIYKDPTTKKLVSKNMLHCELDTLGNIRKITEFDAQSHSHTYVMDDESGLCLNPFGNHTNVRCAVGIDGDYTPNNTLRCEGGGNLLCIDCWKHNDKDKWWKILCGILSLGIYRPLY